MKCLWQFHLSIEAINEKVVGFYRKKVSLGELEASLEDALCMAPANPNDPGQAVLMRVDHLVHLYREGREVRNQEVLRGMLLEAVRGRSTQSLGEAD